MKRFSLILLAAVLPAGCGGGADVQDPGTYDPGPDPSYYPVDTPGEVMKFRTSELGTDKTRDPAKSIEWMKISTTEKTRYLGGIVSVDRILRNDAMGLYNVEIRLKNESESPLSCEVRVVFRSKEGESILGLYDDWRGGERVDWMKLSFDPYGLRNIAVSARMRHAVGFNLYIRTAGGEGEGHPDSGVSDADARKLRRAVDK